MVKPIINLFDTVGLGIIINYPSGIIFSNQTGGTSCRHSRIEGIYIPLCNDLSIPDNQLISPSIDLYNYFIGPKYSGTGAISGIDDEDIFNLTEILKKYNLDKIIIIDENKKSESHESWIFVKIKNLNLLENLPNHLSAILTWENSD